MSRVTSSRRWGLRAKSPGTAEQVTTTSRGPSDVLAAKGPGAVNFPNFVPAYGEVVKQRRE